MSEFHEQAVNDVDQEGGPATFVDEEIYEWTVSQRERVLTQDKRIAELEAELKAKDYELRQERGLKALLANGMPPTGNADFDEVLATHPIAAMIQRGWLAGVTGFDDLPALESAICHFYGVKTIAEAVNPTFESFRVLAEPEREGKPR